MKISRKSVSVIIPVFNEEGRIPNSWVKIESYFSKMSYFKEIIFVNDGSTDRTLVILQNLKANLQVKIISLLKNKGKGFAIKSGVEAASGKIILFMDVDLSTPPETTEKFLKVYKDNCLLIGNRESRLSKLIKRQNYLREKAGQAFTVLANLILKDNCSDYTCGFKVFPASLGRKIFSLAKINRWAFDAEIVFLAKKLGAQVKELPVTWEHRANSRVNLKRDVISTFFELLKIRYFDLTGKYANF